MIFLELAIVTAMTSSLVYCGVQYAQQTQHAYAKSKSRARK